MWYKLSRWMCRLFAQSLLFNVVGIYNNSTNFNNTLYNSVHYWILHADHSGANNGSDHRTIDFGTDCGSGIDYRDFLIRINHFIFIFFNCDNDDDNSFQSRVWSWIDSYFIYKSTKWCFWRSAYFVTRWRYKWSTWVFIGLWFRDQAWIFSLKNLFEGRNKLVQV